MDPQYRSECGIGGKAGLIRRAILPDQAAMTAWISTDGAMSSNGPDQQRKNAGPMCLAGRSSLTSVSRSGGQRASVFKRPIGDERSRDRNSVGGRGRPVEVQQVISKNLASEEKDDVEDRLEA